MTLLGLFPSAPGCMPRVTARKQCAELVEEGLNESRRSQARVCVG